MAIDTWKLTAQSSGQVLLIVSDVLPMFVPFFFVGLQRINPEMTSHPIYLTSFGNLSWQLKKH
jgi:uncharacterized membrane protein